MELYTAGNGQRAAIAVNECGVPCKIHVLNLGQGDQKAADYLKINPTARIPTLIDPERPGGKPLTIIADCLRSHFRIGTSMALPARSLAHDRRAIYPCTAKRPRTARRQHGQFDRQYEKAQP